MSIQAARNGVGATTNQLAVQAGVAAASFEDGSLGGWTSGTNLTLANSTAQAWDGTHSLQVTQSGTGTDQVYTPLINGQTVVVSPGQTWTGSFYLYAPTTVTYAPFLIWSSGRQTTGSPIAGTGGWQRLTVTGTAAAGETSVSLRMENTTVVAGAVWYVDAAQIEQNTVATPFSLPNGPTIAFVAAGAVSANLTVNSPVTVAVPTTASAGDLLIAVIVNNQAGVPTATTLGSAPGWTFGGAMSSNGGASASDVGGFWYYKTAGLTDPGSTATWPTVSATAWESVCVAYSGASTFPVDVSGMTTGGATTSTTYASPSVSPKRPADLLVVVAAVKTSVAGAQNSLSMPAQFTSRVNWTQTSTTVGNRGIGIFDAQLSASGPTTAYTITDSNTAYWTAAQIAIIPAGGATNASDSVNQLLTSHGITAVSRGSMSAPAPNSSYDSAGPLPWYDYDQPFTLNSGITSVSRVELPVWAVGQGSDMLVSLYADSTGLPAGEALASTRVPAAFVLGLVADSLSLDGSPTYTAQANGGAVAGLSTISGALPSNSTTDSVYTYGCVTDSGWVIFPGGSNPSGTAVYPNVYLAQVVGGQLGPWQVGPVLPTPLNASAGCVADGYIVLAGGYTSGGSTPNRVANVWSASWDPSTGSIGSWTTQPALPQALDHAWAVSANGWVYVLGGINAGATSYLNTVYAGQIQNGQISSWLTLPPLPGVCIPSACVVGDQLLVQQANNGSSKVPTVWIATVNADGSLGGWRTGPSMPAGAGFPVVAGNVIVSMPWEFVLNYPVATLTVNGADDIAGHWRQMPGAGWAGFAALAVPASDGTSYAVVGVGSTNVATVCYPSPTLSVPLPASGLTAGGTYHVVIQGVGPTTVNDYLTVEYDVGSNLPNMHYAPPGTFTWTALGAAIPLQVYSGTTGAVLHMLSDGRQDWLIRNSTDQLAGVAETTSFNDGTQLAVVTAISSVSVG